MKRRSLTEFCFYALATGLVTLALSVAIFGCTASQDGSLRSIRSKAAADLYTTCHRYYLFRVNKLLYPDPDQICRAVYHQALRGKPIPNWRM